MKKPRRIVLGVGYLSFDIGGRQVSILKNGTPGMFDPQQIELSKPRHPRDHERVRLVAEILR